MAGVPLQLSALSHRWAASTSPVPRQPSVGEGLIGQGRTDGEEGEGGLTGQGWAGGEVTEGKG